MTYNGENNTLAGRVGLITGAARRIGAALAAHLHAAGMNLVLHYRSSGSDAQALAGALNRQRPDSVHLVQADLLVMEQLNGLLTETAARWRQLDLLVNNASAFYPTPLGSVSERQWDELLGSNLKTPFFLSQEAAPYLRKTKGCIINIVDIYGERPLPQYPVYCAAKAGLIMLTKALASELAPDIRVNGIAPGAVLWAEGDTDTTAQAELLQRVALQKMGEPADIARTALFLTRDAPYITGQIVAVDGGRSLYI